MGAMIFAFQGLECELVKIFVHLVEPAELTKLSANYVSFGLVMKRLLEISEAKLHDTTTKTRLRASVRRALQFADRRNTYVHSHYDMSSWDFRGVVKFTREKGLFGGLKKAKEPQYESFNPDHLYQLAADINRRILPVMRLHDRISDELHPGWREEEFKQEIEMEKYYDQLEIPDEIFESVQRFRNHLEVGSISLSKPPQAS
jgi:hypothetical protein